MRFTEDEPGSAATAPTPRVAPTRLRALAQAVGAMPTPPHGGFDHAFISYSHAADGKLAPALGLADDVQERQQVLPGAPADLAFAPSGGQLLVSYAGGVLREPVGAGSPSAEARLAGDANSAEIIRFDDDSAAELVEANSVGNGQLARWNGQVGSPPQTGVTLPLPGSPLARSERSSGGRIFLTDGQSSELLVRRGNRFVVRTPRFLNDFYGCSLGADGRTLYGTDLGGDVLAWNLHPDGPPLSIATGTEAAPTCLSSPDGSRVLAYQAATNSPVVLYPSTQARSFPHVLRLARRRVVRR